MAGVPFMEEGEELIVIGVSGVKGCVDVKRTDTLVDTRAYINTYEEVNTLAWPCLSRSFAIMSAGSEGTGSTQSKAANIIEDL
eukprot:444786-Ditylum_brightwellii.AAC.2